MNSSQSPEMDRHLVGAPAKTTFEVSASNSRQQPQASSNNNNNWNARNFANNNNAPNTRNQNRNRNQTINSRSFNRNGGVQRNSTSNNNSNNNSNRGNRNPQSSNRQNNLTDRFNGHGTHQHMKVSVKERFVQANCQFVMKAGIQDYGPHLKNPDLPIDWDNVEEVIFKSADDSQVCCPICLSDPIAAKITRCGHIYCWSCILHYLALSDDNYRPCPICYERVRKKELKSATILNKLAFKIQDHVTFQLMKIAKGSTLALPASYTCPDVSVNRLKRNVDATLDMLAKYFVSTPDYLEQLIVREETELFRQKLEYREENMPEICFVEAALAELDERKADLLSIEELTREFSEFWDSEHRLLSRSSPQHQQQAEPIFFYQAEDGQPIFLHSFNVRMLKHEFGDLKHCPASFSAKIIELHGDSASEDIRRRNAHFRHLPLTCELKIVEVELDASVLSTATVDHFAQEVQQRIQERRRKEKRQQKRDRRIDLENHRKIFGLARHGPAFDFNNEEFPTWVDPEVTVAVTVVPAPVALDPLPEESSWGVASPATGSSSSFASLLHGNNNNFQSALARKPQGAAQSSAAASSRILEGADGETLRPLEVLSMSDFLDTVMKKGKPKKNKKGRNAQ